MKIKIDNLTVIQLWGIFDNKFKQTSDISKKWKISEVANEIYQIKSRFDAQKDSIINEYGENKEDGVKILDVSNKHFQELLKCESSISPIHFEEIECLDITLEEFIALKPILLIKEN